MRLTIKHEDSLFYYPFLLLIKPQKLKTLHKSTLINAKLRSLFAFCATYRYHILFLLIFLAFVFLRFYEITDRTNLGWDQADSAWAARSILKENPFRLEGVPVKGNANIFLGPLYYYLITPFYLFTNLDMIASSIFAGVVSVVSFFVFYYITKQLFDNEIALFSLLIYTFSKLVVEADRLQAAYVLIPILSYIVFYFLYKLVTGNEKYILYLAVMVGFGLHIHFTSVFYLFIIFLSSPFFPINKKTLRYGILSIIILLIFISPMLYSVFLQKSSGSNGIIGYLSGSYHGFHLRRFLQLTHDGFISFKLIMQISLIQRLAYVVPFLFIIVFYFNRNQKQTRKERLLFFYLLSLYIIIPWFIFSMYNGELTHYYFSHSRYLAIIVLAYLLMSLFKHKLFLGKLFVIFLFIYYAGTNLLLFFNTPPGNYKSIKQGVESAIKSKQKIYFMERDPFYYTYFVNTEDRIKR